MYCDDFGIAVVIQVCRGSLGGYLIRGLYRVERIRG